MFKTDYQAVRNENKRDRMGMIWNLEPFSEKQLDNSSCSLQNTIKSSPKTFRTAKNFRAPLCARMARTLNWGQSKSDLNERRLPSL